MDNNYTVSVVVLAYNHQLYVAEALDSILAQQCDFTYEIVVGEDSSSDNTRSIIMQYKEKYPGIINLLPKAPNKRVMKNFRDTMKACTGKYVAICSADDYWHDPLKLSKQVGFMEKNPDYGFVHTDLNFLTQHNGKIFENFNRKDQSDIPEGNVFEKLIASKFYIITASVCFLKSHFDKHVDFDKFIEEGFIYEDIATWLEIARHTKFKYLDESTATYRVLENSIAHSNEIAKKFNFLKAHYKIKSYYIDKYSIDSKIADEFRVAYHRKKFDLAYNWFYYPEAVDSYEHLNSRGLASLRLKFKYRLLKSAFLYKTVRKIRKAMGADSIHMEFS